MRIHSLTFAAIGPFAGEYTIPFDALGGSSLFLIDGPTGAGKSTIIDAIVFALYGEVAGRGSDRQRLRSDFAGADTESFTELDFSTSAGRFKVRRTPEYTRAKKRGEGTTTVASSVVAFRSTGEAGWEPVSGSKGEADAEIQRWVGLTKAQFLQTVVLPQGEFTNFLAAESKDRLTILERIFATELYSRIEDAFDERRRTAEQERQEADNAVRTAIRDVYSRLPDAEQPDEAPLEQAGRADVTAALAVLVVDIGRRLAEQTLVAEARAAELLAVDARLEARRSGAEARRRVEDCAALVRTAEAAATKASEDAVAHVPVLVSVDADPADPAAAGRVVDHVLGQLEQAAASERQLPIAEADLAGRETSIARIADELGRLDRERDHDLPARLRGLASDLVACLAQAREAAEAAAARQAAVVQARLDGMAAELAEDLSDGRACPVCGALNHPQPATSVGPAVTALDVDAAAGHRAAADRHQHDVDLQRARLAAMTELPEVPGDVAEPGIGLAEIAAEIEVLQLRSRDLVDARTQLEVRRAGEVAARDQLQAAIEEQRLALQEARGEFASVALHVAALTSARTSLSLRERAAIDLAQARTARSTADAALAELAARLPEAVEADDTADLIEGRRVLASEAQSAETQRAGLTSLLTDLQARAAKVDEAFDRLDDARARTAEVIALAAIVRGADGNLLSQPLSAYVVQTMFDEVLHVANQRLRAMLDGRFELKSTEGRTGRKLTGLGLGLEVRDLRTDTVRKTSTLSGGEGFCASLALALGLADTVRAHAGGIDIGMLFIDEGFGSLDIDRLDDVMSELGRLQADGRTVGVISHVTEMKRTIQERIDVKELDASHGSTIEVSWVD